MAEIGAFGKAGGCAPILQLVAVVHTAALVVPTSNRRGLQIKIAPVTRRGRASSRTRLLFPGPKLHHSRWNRTRGVDTETEIAVADDLQEPQFILFVSAVNLR